MEIHGHKIRKDESGSYTDGYFYGETPESVKKQIEDAYEYGYIGDILDAHSCVGNAEYSSNGPSGEGDYCTQCGRLVSSPQEVYVD